MQGGNRADCDPPEWVDFDLVAIYAVIKDQFTRFTAGKRYEPSSMGVCGP